jgi:Kef-type K+ transport system membrane component KefB
MEMLQVFLALMILLGVTRVFGALAQRLGQPGLVGELVAGVALGAAAVAAPGLHTLLETPAIELVSELGIFFLIL